MSAQSIHIRSPNQINPRQRTVLTLLAAGQNTKCIAIEMGISEKTVEYHRLQLMSAVGLFSYPQLTQLALRLGMITITV